jgi:hypothetical protein
LPRSIGVPPTIAAREPPVHAMNETCDTIGVSGASCAIRACSPSTSDHRLRTLTEPSPGMRRPAGIVAPLATVHLMSRAARTRSTASCKRHFADDRDLAALLTIKQRAVQRRQRKQAEQPNLWSMPCRTPRRTFCLIGCSGARATPWDIHTRCWHNGRMIGAGAIALAQRKSVGADVWAPLKREGLSCVHQS